ncbi:MAG: phosphotransferase, partial [Bacteroidota bacterium]
KAQFFDYLPKDGRQLGQLLEKLLAIFATYPIHEHNYGLIHYDIHHGNYFLTEPDNEIILFDFEMTSQSWYINEVTVVLFYMLHAVPVAEQQAITDLFLSSFVAGYREVYPLEEQELAKIPLFLLYRDLLVYAFTFRMWGTDKVLTEHESKFRTKLSDSIDRRRIGLNM